MRAACELNGRDAAVRSLTMTSRGCRRIVATLRASRGFLPHASRRRHFGAPRAEEDYIESTTNALVKRFKRCHRKKYRDGENVALVEGRALVAAAGAGDDVERCSSRTT